MKAKKKKIAALLMAGVMVASSFRNVPLFVHAQEMNVMEDEDETAGEGRDETISTEEAAVRVEASLNETVADAETTENTMEESIESELNDLIVEDIEDSADEADELTEVETQELTEVEIEEPEQETVSTADLMESATGFYSEAGIRCYHPVSAIVGKPYEKKVLNIFDKAGDSHTLKYKCRWKNGMLENELPANLSINNNGVISGTPDEAATLYIWFDISWDNSSNTFSTTYDEYGDEDYSRAVILNIYEDKDEESGYQVIDDSPTRIEVNKNFVLPANRDMWFEFVNPGSWISYDVKGEYEVITRKAGNETLSDVIFDANGFPLSEYLISGSSRVSPGETYYMYLRNTTNKDEVVRVNSFPDNLSIEDYIRGLGAELGTGEEKIELVKKNVEKSFNGDNNAVWDVYRTELSLDYSKLPAEGYEFFWSSFAVIAPYKVHFLDGGYDFDFPGCGYTVTSNASTDAILSAFDKISVPVGMSKMGISNVTYICADEHLDGVAHYPCEIYVPAGKVLISKNGAFWDFDSLESNNEEKKSSAGGGSGESKTTVKSITQAAVSGIKKSYTYTGKNQTPVPTVTLSGKKLKKDTDYTLKYSYNKNAGTAKITITGKGNYTGNKNVSFTISKALNPIKLKISSKTFKRAKLTKAVSFSIGTNKAQGKVTYVLSNVAKKAKLKVSMKGKITVPKNVKKGTYTIKVKAAGNSNYKAASKTVKVCVR